MKTYGEWLESFSAAGVAQDARGDKDSYGNLAAEGLQEVVDALRLLAAKNPQAYNFIVAKIRGEVQKIDPSSGASVGVAGRRYGSAVANSGSMDNQQSGINK